MTSDEHAIRELIAKWMDATKTHDLDAVFGLMSDDVVFMVPGREPFGKREFMTAWQNMRETRIDGTSQIRELEVLGDWAYLRGHLQVAMTSPAGTTVRRAGYTLTILRKQPDGRWLLARDANLLTEQT